MTTTTLTRPEVLSATSIIGDDVYNHEDTKLGDIKELMVDVDTGKVAYAVLSFGGFLGMGDKLFAVPFNALKLNADKKYFMLNADKEKLKSAPGFDKDNWPSTADRTWGAQVHEFYGTKPYWETTTTTPPRT
jgi:sporulation protein YlmC with PRC-barrel domain